MRIRYSSLLLFGFGISLLISGVVAYLYLQAQWAFWGEGPNATKTGLDPLRIFLSSFPPLVHVLGFSCISASMTVLDKRRAYAIPLFWFLLNAFFELLQKDSALLDHLSSIHFLIPDILLNHIYHGVFSPWDLLSAYIGSVIALVLILLLHRRSRRQSRRQRPRQTRPWQKPLLPLVGALGILTIAASSTCGPHSSYHCPSEMFNSGFQLSDVDLNKRYRAGKESSGTESAETTHVLPAPMSKQEKDIWFLAELI